MTLGPSSCVMGCGDSLEATDLGVSQSRSRLFVDIGLAWGSGSSPTVASSQRMSLPRERAL